MKCSPLTSSAVPSRNAAFDLQRMLRGCGWLFVLFTIAKYGFYRPLTIHGVDYPKHWYAARAVLQGRSTYLDPELWLAFNYPQFSALLTCWIGFFEINTAEIIWKMMMLGWIILAWSIAAKYFKPAVSIPTAATDVSQMTQIREALARHWLLATAILISFYSPAHAIALFVGQVEPFNALFGMAFIAAIMTRRPRLAGMFWALLCLFKMLPVLLLLPVLLWRQWRILQGWLATMATYGLILIVTGRLGFEWFFVREFTPRVPFHWRYISCSLHRSFLIFLAPPAWHEDPVMFTRVWHWTGAGVLAAYLLSLALLMRRGASFLAAIQVGLLFALLFTPILENVHMLLVLPVLLLQVKRWIEERTSPTALPFLLIGWIILCLTHYFTDFWMGSHWHILFILPYAVLLLVLSTILDHTLTPCESTS